MYEIIWRGYRDSITSLCLGCGFSNGTTNAQPITAKLDKWNLCVAQEAGLWRRHGLGWDSCQSRIWRSHRVQKGCLQLLSKTIWSLTWAFLQRRPRCTRKDFQYFWFSRKCKPKAQWELGGGSGRGDTFSASTGVRLSWAPWGKGQPALLSKTMSQSKPHKTTDSHLLEMVTI